ncbi:MAG: 50S ribosomal protein L3 [Candidatus Omnitrophica bacterium]|nr:50S ribosomal protein L3 [Candidatus Omnitrophota bacterium]
MSGLLGKKIGCTHIFDTQGKMVSVTAVEAGPCVVLKVGDKKVQLGFDVVKEKHVKKPQLAVFKKINTAPRKFIREVVKDAATEYKVGEELKTDIFKDGDYVDVIGISKGKGFQGGMKRWNWSGTPMTHGSTSHRRVGSIGSSTTPGRVWKGHHMPGHMGCARVTVQNLKVVGVDVENNLLMVKGAIPGSNGGYVMIKNSLRKKLSVAAAAIQTKKDEQKGPKKPAKK